MLKLDNGMVIDSEDLAAEQREAYIEFAIHLAAPKLAKLLSEGQTSIADSNQSSNQVVNEAFFKYPLMMTLTGCSISFCI
ncbi:hypothetical protein BHU72_01900 [Desulfuribacillus stibiiarsenatis]|uniref:Uncharacterized protein n=1 Tax=Desulfuribacillus stibiiarsenatis TaxID=1390249 RepID=A0A1E5L640_9FIRM|nr:hypothetical protein [Desulfuribacillus stibiiarsenatis]OEH85576.1 hypothetical protein BHU72_01900 [Desulfuribacillus stibiiarsenatis]